MNTPTKARQQNLIQETFSRLQARLLTQLQVMSRDLNTEAVHQTRIAIRRLRAALRAMKPYLRASLRRRLIATLRQLTSNLEATREADIRELAVKTLLGGLYVADRSQAHQLRVTVAAQRATARQELRDLLTSAAWRHRLSLLQRDSRQPLVNPSRKDSLLLIRDVLARRQHRLHHALHHVGRNSRKLHRLRLRIKASRRVLITVADGSEKKVVDCAAQIVAKSKAKIELFSVVRLPPPVLGMTRVDDPQITRSYVSRRPREQADLHDYRHPGWRINASI